ncbi:MAG: cyclic nucleotide-binding domain-containing protein [Pseudomonadota bacterium]
MTASSKPEYRVKIYHQNQTIFKEGQESNVAYLIKQGAVVLYKTVNDKRLALYECKKGEVFGEFGIITGETRTASAMAAEYTELVVVDKETFSQALNKSPRIIRALSNLLIQRLIKANEMRFGRLTSDIFLSSCRIIEIMHRGRRPPGANPRAAELPVYLGYAEVVENVGAIINATQLEIEFVLKKLRNFNLIEIINEKIGQVSEKLIKIVNPPEFGKKAELLHHELRESQSSLDGELEFIPLDVFAQLAQTTPDLIRQKIGADEVPTDLLFVQKKDALDWLNEVGESFFRKVKKSKLEAEDLAGLDDITLVDDSTLQDVFSEIGFYKLGVLAWAAGKAAREKILANVSSKVSEMLKEEIAAVSTIDAGEVSGIEDELVSLIKRKKGLTP